MFSFVRNRHCNCTRVEGPVTAAATYRVTRRIRSESLPLALALRHPSLVISYDIQYNTEVHWLKPNSRLVMDYLMVTKVVSKWVGILYIPGCGHIWSKGSGSLGICSTQIGTNRTRTLTWRGGECLLVSE